MEVAIRTKDRKLSPDEETHIRKRLDRLPQVEPISDGELIIAHEHGRRGELQVVQLTLRAHGTLLRVEERDMDLLTAVDAALAKIDRQIERYKGRYTRRRKSQSDRDSLPVLLDDAAVPPEPDAPLPVVRTKRFPVMPMTKEEAVEQMELLSHTFFIYWDAEDKQYAVVYRRNNGDYGVLEPELAGA